MLPCLCFADDIEKTFAFDQFIDLSYSDKWILEQRYGMGKGKLDTTYPILIEDIYNEYSAATEYSIGDRVYVKPLDAVVTNEWAADYDFSLNDLITSEEYAYRCTTDSGSSGGTKPVFPTIPNETVADGGLYWTCVGFNRVIVTFYESLIDANTGSSPPDHTAFPYYPVCTSWAATTAYAVGAFTAPVNDYVYKVTSITTGISGAVEPTWPTTIGNTVEDGGVTWECMGGNLTTSPDGGYETRTVTWETVTEDIEFPITLSIPPASASVKRYYVLRAHNRVSSYESLDSNQLETTFEILTEDIMKPLYRGKIIR
jgi:hypothetical protein